MIADTNLGTMVISMALLQMVSLAPSSFSESSSKSPKASINRDRPPRNEPRPYMQISGKTEDQYQMEAAEYKSTSVLMTDWSKFTSEEYFQAAKDSGLDLL